MQIGLSFKVEKQSSSLMMLLDSSQDMGEFDSANTENTIKVFKQSLKWGIPKFVHTDHGTQFFANEQEGKKQGESDFTKAVRGAGSKHILARVKHPQANEKAERVIGTLKRLWKELGV